VDGMWGSTSDSRNVRPHASARPVRLRRILFRSHPWAAGPHALASELHAVAAGPHALASELHAVAVGPHAPTAELHTATAGPHAPTSGLHAGAAGPDALAAGSAARTLGSLVRLGAAVVTLGPRGPVAALGSNFTGAASFGRAVRGVGGGERRCGQQKAGGKKQGEWSHEFGSNPEEGAGSLGGKATGLSTSAGHPRRFTEFDVLLEREGTPQIADLQPIGDRPERKTV
jgi:hypothetical protein